MVRRESIFKNWEARCSGLGHLCTYKENISKSQLLEITALENEKESGLNANGNKVKWTDTKQEKLDGLIAKRDAPDELTQGQMTYLDDVFRSEFWGRRRLVFNKYMDKGNFNEQDSLDLLSEVDGVFYEKNLERFSNGFIQGEPDVKYPYIIDAKSNWDMDTFDKADLTDHYKWQIKGYIWLMLSNKILKTYKGELAYCLVNSRPHQLLNEKNSLYYKMGLPDDDNPMFIEALQQIERNMIFDIEAWMNLVEFNEFTGENQYPNQNYVWYNTSLDFDVPPKLRVKRFEVILNTREVALIKRRVKMARKYLMAKEEEVYQYLGL